MLLENFNPALQPMTRMLLVVENYWTDSVTWPKAVFPTLLRKGCLRWRESPRTGAGQHRPTADISSPGMPVDAHLEVVKGSQSSR
jgi:hypothetical protein